VHQIWQVDAKEQQTLADGTKVCWLTITDEKSCGLIAAIPFEVNRICEVDPIELRKGLEIVFTEYGKPESIKVDNGRPLADPKRESIPPLVLWLYSHNIQVIFNRPGRPTDNSKVERMQGVSKSLSEPRLCQNVEELKDSLQEACHFQRKHYRTRTLKKKTRTEVYPELDFPSDRAFQKGTCNMDFVHQYLSSGSWSRKVSKVGQCSFMGKLFHVGQKYAGEQIIIEFNLESKNWMLLSSQMILIKEIDGSFINPDSIHNLSLFQ